MATTVVTGADEVAATRSPLLPASGLASGVAGRVAIARVASS